MTSLTVAVAAASAAPCAGSRCGRSSPPGSPSAPSDGHSPTGSTASTSPHRPAPYGPAPPCDWDTEWRRTLDELGEDPANWFKVRGDLMGEASGRTHLASGQAYIHPDLPCEMVGDVIRHEHAHLPQARAYGADGARNRYGDRLEIVADCASMLLGSTYTPYIDQAGGCTASDLADAHTLIEGAR